jgi:hypothetical protein
MPSDLVSEDATKSDWKIRETNYAAIGNRGGGFKGSARSLQPNSAGISIHSPGGSRSSNDSPSIGNASLKL